jgi:hypothetical protein
VEATSLAVYGSPPPRLKAVLTPGRTAGAARGVRLTARHPHVLAPPTGQRTVACHHHATSGPAPGLSARRIWRTAPAGPPKRGLLSGGDSGDEARVRLPSHHPHALRRSRGGGLRVETTGPFWITLFSFWALCVSTARASAGAPADPRPEREPTADHPVTDAARVRALPGAAPDVPAMQAHTAQVGRAAAARTDGGDGEPAGAHGSPSPLAAPRAVGSSPAISLGVRGSFPGEMSTAGANSSA